METANYIAGEWVSSERIFSSVSPEDGSVLGVAALASQDDVCKAVSAARAAFPAWSETSVADRAKYVLRAAEILAAEYGNMGDPTPLKELIRTEMGKRLAEADIEVIESSDMLRFFAEQGPHCLADRPIALNHELWPTKRSTIGFLPLGIVGVIKPWNYPLELPLWAIGAALVAGNSVVFKPSELTPFVGAKIVDVFKRAELPKGVLNMVTGDGTTGAALVEHPDVDMVSFTGSIPVGREIARKCAERLCRFSLELGGKDAMVVLPDADLDLAVNGAVWGAFTNCGQVCVGVRRLLLASAIKKEFILRFTEATQALRIGKDIGPLVSEAQRARVEAHVQQALRLGAKALRGARRPDGTEVEGGYFYLPTILTDTTSEMLVETEDTFGPVVFIKEFSTDEEAIAITNSVPYDLGASVWTRDAKRGLEFARKLRTGMVWINDVNVAFPQAPWCGHRWSGHGIELSEYSFREYAATRHTNSELGSDKRRAWWFPYA